MWNENLCFGYGYRPTSADAPTSRGRRRTHFLATASLRRRYDKPKDTVFLMSLIIKKLSLLERLRNFLKVLIRAFENCFAFLNHF